MRLSCFAPFYMALAIASALLVACSAAAVTAAPSTFSFQVVHDFGPAQGQGLPALTVGIDGNVYGKAIGTAFRIDETGFSTIHEFSDGTSSPLVVGNDGNLYGYTPQTFFRLDYQGNYTALLSLPRNLATDLVLASDGSFYAGTAPECEADGCQSDGALIKITNAGTYTIIGANVVWLSAPQLVGSDGAIYGTRSNQWGIPTASSIFRLDANGNLTTIRQMTNGEGFLDNLALGSDGMIYATSRYGGRYGTLVRFDNTGSVNLSHEFAGTDGAYPVGSLSRGRDGAIYGVTEYGGFGWGAGSGAGTVYRVDTAGTFTSLHSFNWIDGGNPNQGLLLARDGALYGVTWTAVFRVGSAGAFATYPVIPSNVILSSPLVQGNGAALYGTADYWDSSAGNYSALVYRLVPVTWPPSSGGCGLGPELALLLPGVMWLRRRREV